MDRRRILIEGCLSNLPCQYRTTPSSLAVERRWLRAINLNPLQSRVTASSCPGSSDEHHLISPSIIIKVTVCRAIKEDCRGIDSIVKVHALRKVFIAEHSISRGKWYVNYTNGRNFETFNQNEFLYYDFDAVISGVNCLHLWNEKDTRM